MRYYLVSAVVAVVLLAACAVHQAPRETVLDGVATTYAEIFEVPDVARWCERLELEPLHVDVGGCELYVEVEGQGTPLVLLHGGPGGTHHYFHPHFSRAAGFARVIYYDQRACGLSCREPGAGYTIAQAVEDLDLLRQALDIDRWVVVGFSYGGLLAQIYATEYGEHLAGLVLVASAFGPHLQVEPSRQHDFIRDAERERMQGINTMPGLTGAQRMYNRYLNGDWKRQNFYRPTRERLAEQARYEWVHDRGFRPGIIESLADVDLEGAFHDFTVPTLIMDAKWDLTWGADKPALFHGEHPNAELLLFERSGHSIFADEPDRFFAELERFVDSLR